MSITRRLTTALLVAAGALLARPAAAQEFKVVAHPSVGADQMPAATISKLFLRQARTLPGGATAQPVDLPASSPVRAAFSKAVHRRPPANIDQYWQGQIFAGAATPPPRKSSDDEVIAFVRATPGAIGYVSASANVAGVKVITVQ